MPKPATKSDQAGQRLGRRVGILIHAAVLASFTLVCSVQIIRQVWWPSIPSGPAVDCTDGLKSLHEALLAARRSAAEIQGEREALQRFRQTLGLPWERRLALEPLCRGNARAMRALGELDRLRYAEEHAVRYEAAGLSRRRRRVDALMAELPRPSSSPLGP